MYASTSPLRLPLFIARAICHIIKAQGIIEYIPLSCLVLSQRHDARDHSQVQEASLYFTLGSRRLK